MKALQIMAISGSLRSNSSNTNILKAIAGLAPENVVIHLYEGLDKLPHFNPDVDEKNGYVADFRNKVDSADGVIISTPEYAFGIPGVLKNALDWIVSTGELNEKPAAAISASPLNTGGENALTSLLLTLTALGTIRNKFSSLAIPNIKSKLDASGTIIDNQLAESLDKLLENLLDLIEVKQS